ncbi:MAG: DUF4351 domain-containing protein [Planctomycetota bacterium]
MLAKCGGDCAGRRYLDPETHDQVLHYSVHLAARTQSDRTPPTLVVPIVVYHGKQPWIEPAVHPHLVHLGAELAVTLGALQPRVHFLVDDLTRCTETELQRPGMTALAQLALLCEKLRREGHTKGRAEGTAEGHTKGRADAILRQMKKRFGPVPTVIIELVHAASLPELDRWTDRILDAATLDEVLAE